MHKLSLLAVVFCCQLGSAQAQTAPPAPSDDEHIGEVVQQLDDIDSWSLSKIKLRDVALYWENDGTLTNIVEDTDRYYTNGTGIELSFDPQFNDAIKQRLAPADEWNSPRFGLGLAIKQQIYTGIDITDPTPAANDHPYGGYLHFAFSFQRADDQKHDHFELDLGVVGERSQAELIQKWVHNTFPDQDQPQGWGNQLANELAINFTYERTWKTRRGEVKGVAFEMLPAIGFDLGNVYTRARGRLTLRAGMNLPNDFGPTSLLGHKDHTVGNAPWGGGDWSIYGYATLGVDAVARNIFLDGNTFASSPSVDSEPFVAMATLGFVTRYKALYLGISQTFQTEEFESQPDQQTWGTIVLGCSFDF
ncbi:MAG: lipid A deacylase LpxR family protein [Phycisphaerales bacterium]